jgi:hypothetical protein
MPNFITCVNNNNHATVQAVHAHDKKTRADIVRMNTALANVFLEAMSSQVRAFFQQRCLHEPNIVFVDLFLWFVEQYGKMMAKDRKANCQCMAPDWHPANGFNALILCLFTSTAYASSAGFKMNDVNIVDIGLRIIKQCRMYSKEYKAWIACKSICPAITEMFDTFKTFWAAKITLVDQTAIPTSLHGYGMATVNDNNALVVSYGKSIANFGAAYATTQESVKTQGLTIATLQGQVNVMQQYCMAPTTTLPDHLRGATAARSQQLPWIITTQQQGQQWLPTTAATIKWHASSPLPTDPIQAVQKLALLPHSRGQC